MSINYKIPTKTKRAPTLFVTNCKNDPTYYIHYGDSKNTVEYFWTVDNVWRLSAFSGTDAKYMCQQRKHRSLSYRLFKKVGVLK